MAATEQQISEFGAKMSWSVLTWAIGVGQSVLKFTYSPHTSQEILTFLSSQTGLSANTISLADSGYYTIEWSDWLKFINSPITENIKKYVTDVWDCENYAFWFHTFSDLIMGINTGGTAFGSVLDPASGRVLFGHGFNMIVCTENGNLALKLFEPQTKQWKTWEPGKANILPVQQTQSWWYKPYWLIYY